MNISMIRYILCWVLQIEGMFMLLPCVTAVIYQEKKGIPFLAVMIICILIGSLGKRRKPESQVFYAREGFITVSLAWVILSMFGALPFTLNGDIPSYTDALFETISGFTTTGASILTAVEPLSRCSLIWRSFTHWLGGMGVLVFVLTVLPKANSSTMHLMRAESPGPDVGKLVPRVTQTAQILYGIYAFITAVEIVLLLVTGMPAFDALCMSFGTAGTGGFGVLNNSAASYTTIQQGILTVFMLLFGVNFNAYFLIFTKKWKEALGSEEVRAYFGIIACAILLIVWNARSCFASLFDAFHHTAFTVASIITTTGFATEDFNLWPQFSKMLLVALMFIGACAGSTGGGMKVSRIVIVFKSIRREIHSIIHPRKVERVRFEGTAIDKEIIHSTERFFAAYIFVFTISCLIIALENLDFASTFTSVAATLNNIGPGLEIVGATGNYSSLSVLSKYVLMFDMLAGRLELYPMLVLFLPTTWRNH